MTRSNAELLLATQLSQAGIPFEREYRWHPERKFRADFAVWMEPLSKKYGGEADILIEVDGATWTLGRHNRPSAIPKEYERTAQAAILGYRIIRCTTEQVEDGTAFGWIRQALGLEEAA